MRYVVGLTLVLLGWLPAVPALADIQREAPWQPIAYAYRSALFLIALKPVDWPLIEHKFTTDDGGRVFGAPAKERLERIDRDAGTRHWPAIAEAIRTQDRRALFDAATRAVSHGIRFHLARAAAALGDATAAAQEVAEAEQLYRSFADFIEQTDAKGFRELGLAWLDLRSSIGHPGLGDTGAMPPDDAKFASARAAIESYLTRNYEPESFAPRRNYLPIPEERFRADPNLTVRPWLPPGTDLNDQVPLPRLVLNFEQQGIDERDLFLVAYGDMLFDSPEIFGEPARSFGISCATCHNRGDVNRRFFIPGISPQPGSADVDGSFFNPRFNDHRADALDIPSLRGIRLTGPYGRDGRFGSLRDFTRNVIVNEFAGDEPTPLMLDALVTYMREFDFLPAVYLDRDARLTKAASAAARRGEAIFNRPFAQMGNRSCASCHVPDSHFTDNQVHDIGSGGAYKGDLSGAFETPTLLGIAHTAPYFHDGSLPTLADVVAWFDRRYKLGLSPADQADLAAYLEAVGTGERPFERFEGKSTPFRLMVEEKSVFLSTLDTLLPARDRAHTDLLLRSVAADMARDVSAMTNREAMSKVFELTDLLWQLREAVNANRWEEAERLWAAYRELEQEYDPELY